MVFKKTYNNSEFMDLFVLFVLFFISDDTLTFGTTTNVYFINLKYIIYFVFTLLLIAKYDYRIFFKKKSIYFYAVVISIILTSLINFDITGGYIYQILVLLLGYLISQLITFEDFSYKFSKCMYLLCIISIFVFMVVNTFSWSLDLLPIYKNSIGTQFYNLYICAIFDDVGHLSNTSIFREPGVFAIYILFGIVIELFCKKIINLKYLFIFIVTLFTTFSTAGYIVLLLLISSYMLKSVKKNKYIIMLFILVVLIVMYINTAITPIIFDKLDKNSNSYESFAARISSIVVNYYIFTENFVVGIGLTKFTDVFYQYSRIHSFLERGRAANSTNTFMSIFAVYGLIYGLILIYALKCLAQKISNSALLQISIFASFVLMFSNEDLRYSLFFCSLIFWGLKSASMCR